MAAVEILLPFMGKVKDVTGVLAVSAQFHAIELTKWLIAFQRKVDPTVSLSEIVYLALRVGDLEIPRHLVDLGIEVPLDTVEKAVREIVELGFLDGVKLLFELIEPDQRLAIAERSLPAAANARDSAMTVYFMSFSVQLPDSLHIAATSGSFALVSQLLTIDSSPSFVNRLSAEGTALCIAASAGNVEIVRLLLSVPGIRADLGNLYGETPLVIASRAPNLGVMAAIVSFYGDNISQHSSEVNRAFLTAFSFPLLRAPPPVNQNPVPKGQPVPEVVVNPEALIAKSPDLADVTFELAQFFTQFPFLDINYCRHGDSVLLVAGRTGNTQLVRELLRFPDLNVNAYDSGGNTALIFSAASGDFESVRVLAADSRTDINRCNFCGATAFACAVMKGHREIAQHLLECPTFIINQNAPIALGYAMIIQRDDMVTFIINLDFDVNAEAEYALVSEAPERMKARSALMTAVSLQSVPYVAQIVNHRQFDPRASGIRRALFRAVRTGNLPVFQALVPFWDIAMCNRRGETLFVSACRRGSTAILQHITDLPGFAPTQREVTQGLVSTIGSRHSGLRILMRYEPDWIAKLPIWINGRQPDRVRSNPNILFCFLDETPETPDELFGVPLLFAAARLRNKEAVNTLLEIEAVDPNARGEFGQTVFSEISTDRQTLRHSSPLARLDLNAQDLDGNTPLMHAIRRMAIQTVTALIAQGVDLKIRNLTGVLFGFR
jgi:ankyrin repeat protein